MEDPFLERETALHRGSRENSTAAHRDLPRLQVPTQEKKSRWQKQK